jgi:fatty acid desaturase
MGRKKSQSNQARRLIPQLNLNPSMTPLWCVDGDSSVVSTAANVGLGHWRSVEKFPMLHQMNAHSMIPPQKLNTALSAGVVFLGLGILWFSSRSGVIGNVALGVVYSFLLLTNYALMHEAAHRYLHGNKKINRGLGTLLSWLFPMSFTLFTLTHIMHHRTNRTRHEMFDYYDPDDNKLKKYGMWYAILTGVYWIVIPLGSLLWALAPKLFQTKPFKNAPITAVLFREFDKDSVAAIRWECTLGIVFWIMAWIALDLRWSAVLIAYACFAFNWSTRQYVSHAFTPREVREGAHNLKVGKFMGCVLLNGQWELVHHQYPALPWIYLGEYGKSSTPPISYWRQYLRLWKGPQPNPQSAPSPRLPADRQY